MLQLLIAAQEGHGEEDERHQEGHFAPKENAFDAEGHPAALVATAQQEGGCIDGQIAQKQFRELPMLSGLPTTREAPAQPLSLEHHVDGLDTGRARGEGEGSE